MSVLNRGARKGLTEKVTFEYDLRKLRVDHVYIWGRASQGAGTARGLRQEDTWRIH